MSDICPVIPGFSAAWIGIGGVDEGALIQVGTEQDAAGAGASYSAWWEILPAPAVRIRSLAVRPGDTIRAAISRVAGGRWRITISDARGGRYTTTRAWRVSGTSAEWIEEAPQVNGRPAPLAATSAVRFDLATANGRNPRLVASQAGILVEGDAVALVPSAPDSGRDGFVISAGPALALPPSP